MANGFRVLPHLREVATPDDFVALKLDIDDPPTEQSIVHALLRDHDTLRLVDELFFEYHFRWGASERQLVGAKKWRGGPSYGRNSTVDDALCLM